MTTVSYLASLLTGEITLAQHTDTVAWFITHGLASPAAGTFTEVRVPRDTPATDDEIEAAIRDFADDLYGTQWAGIYRPHQYDRCIGRFAMKRRERAILTRISVEEDV
jgi:hypothetical protein